MLLSNLNLLAAAPGGVARLRELILTLAVQGKLVPQDPKDEPASALLKKIRVEKDQLIADGKIKRDKPPPKISDGEIPFDLPKGWVWERLGVIGNIFSGNSINSTEKESKYALQSGLPYIATKDVGYGLEPLDYENGIRIPLGETKFKVALPGSVLICAEGGSAGRKSSTTTYSCHGSTDKLKPNSSTFGFAVRWVKSGWIKSSLQRRMSAPYIKVTCLSIFAPSRPSQNNLASSIASKSSCACAPTCASA